MESKCFLLRDTDIVCRIDFLPEYTCVTRAIAHSATYPHLKELWDRARKGELISKDEISLNGAFTSMYASPLPKAVKFYGATDEGLPWKAIQQINDEVASMPGIWVDVDRIDQILYDLATDA